MGLPAMKLATGLTTSKQGYHQNHSLLEPLKIPSNEIQCLPENKNTVRLKAAAATRHTLENSRAVNCTCAFCIVWDTTCRNTIFTPRIGPIVVNPSIPGISPCFLQSQSLHKYQFYVVLSTIDIPCPRIFNHQTNIKLIYQIISDLIGFD